MSKQTVDHYKWLDQHLSAFFTNVGLNPELAVGCGAAHGDKCYGYRDSWAEHSIPFHHGVAIYMLTYFAPFSAEVRVYHLGNWVNPGTWVIENYEEFKPFLVKLDSV